MTEDEARKKWCPFARVALPHADECGWQGPANRDPYESHNYNGAQCIGSECMAWRWAVDEMRERYPKSPTNAVVEEYRHREGFCGLAGKP